MSHPPPLVELWTLAKRDFSRVLTPPLSQLFLGTMLAYPLHEALREEFGIIPAAWLIGPSKTGKTELTECIHALYHPSPEDTFHHALEAIDLQSITEYHAAFRHAPYHLHLRGPAHPQLTEYFAHACDMGHICRGVYGSVRYNVTRSAPPLITSRHPTHQTLLNTRYLRFSLNPATLEHPEAEAHFTELRQHRKTYHRLLPALINNWKWQKTTLSLARKLEVELATSSPTLPLRQRLQIAIAAAVFHSADHLLTKEPIPESISPLCELLDLLPAPLHFKVPV